MITIIDYGMGNLGSVQKALEKLGYPGQISSSKDDISKADGVILPGVGAFKDAMENLKQGDLMEVIYDVHQKGKPFLGICLGLQLLFDYSEEMGKTAGLGIFSGAVKRFETDLKVPHMGWNQLAIKKESPLFIGIPDQVATYFVHSYHVVPENKEIILATTDYDGEVVAIVGEGNTFGIQFHPEKSSDFGLKILNNFGKLVARC